MNKLKIYLDTSVISHLDAPDTPEKMDDTKKLWEEFKQEKYRIVISDLMLIEIERCKEPKLSFLRKKLVEINYELIEKNKEAKRLSDQYFEFGGIPPRSKDDSLHIAIATVNSCDIIVSWNFKHIVNLRAIKAVELVNMRENYKQIRILSPTMMCEGE